MARRELAGFEDRREAGRQLALALRDERLDDAVVIGLARGGVVVAAEVAQALHLPLDAVAVRKVGHPLEPEYAIGAVTPRGGVYVRAHDGLTEEQVQRAVAAAQEKAEALDARIHTEHPPLSLEGKLCLLVDDGLATGATMIAAVRWARAEGARRVIVCVPVGAAETVELLRREADDVVALVAPEAFMAVGFWYRDFLPVSDEEVATLLSASSRAGTAVPAQRQVRIPAADVELPGDLTVPLAATGVVLFAHGSGSGRASPRNRLVARLLNEAGVATLLFDLLTEDEALDRDNVFDIPLLATRLVAAHRFVEQASETESLPVGYFGASTGAAAALVAAADPELEVAAVVSRGGRPDLATGKLGLVTAPTLLIVGGHDDVVIELNRRAAEQLRCEHELVIVPGATHLFEESGALEAVAEHASSWFRKHLAG
jgi:putative phosphoribosyl transferase